MSPELVMVSKTRNRQQNAAAVERLESGIFAEASDSVLEHESQQRLLFREARFFGPQGPENRVFLCAPPCNGLVFRYPVRLAEGHRSGWADVVVAA